MLHLIQYHSPDVMECGVDDIDGPPYGIFTSKAPGNPIGSTVWVIGKTTESQSPVYLACSFVVDEVLASSDPRFLYEYVGAEGVSYHPLRCVSEQAWYPQLLRLTGNFRFGLTEASPTILAGLRELTDSRPRSVRRIKHYPRTRRKKR